MKRYTAIMVLCIISLLAGLASLLAGCRPTVDGIRERGALRVGVKDDVPGFGYFNAETNCYEGMEIDLAKLIAEKLIGKETDDCPNVEFIPVTTSTRGPLLDNGEIDIIIATFTITEERKHLYSFSSSYYTDFIGFMVKKDSGIKNVDGLDGKTVGVVQLAPTKRELQIYMGASGLSFNFEQYISALEAKVALDIGAVDAFSIGNSILNGYLDETTELLPDKCAAQPLGIATRLNDKDLSREIDSLVKRWLKDGTIAGLIKKHNI